MDGRSDYPGLDGRGLLAAAGLAPGPHPPASPATGLMGTAFGDPSAARRQLSDLGRSSTAAGLGSLAPHYQPRYLPPSMALHGPRSSYLMSSYLSPPSGSGPGPATDPFKSPLTGHGLQQYWSPSSTSAGTDGFGRYMPGLTAGPSSMFSPYLPLLGPGDAAGLPLYPQTPAQPPHHQPYHRIYDLHKELLHTHQAQAQAQAGHPDPLDLYEQYRQALALPPAHRSLALEALLASGVAAVSSSGELLAGSAAGSSSATSGSNSNSSRSKQEPSSDRASKSHGTDSATRKLGSSDTKSTVTIKSETENGVKVSHRDHSGHGQETRHSSDSKTKYIDGGAEAGCSRRSKRSDCASKESSSHKDSSAGAMSRKVVSPCDKVKMEGSTEQCPHKKSESNNNSLDRTSSPGSRNGHKTEDRTATVCLHADKPKTENGDTRLGVVDSDHYNRSQDGALCLTVKPKTESCSPQSSRKGDSCRVGVTDCDVVGDDVRTQSVSTTTVTTITACSGAGSTVVTSTSPDGGVYSMYPSSKPLMSAYLPAGMAVSAEGKAGKQGCSSDYTVPYYQPGISFPHQQVSQEGRKVHATTFTPEVGTLPSATLTTSSVSSSGTKSSPTSGLDSRTRADSRRSSAEHNRRLSVDSIGSHSVGSHSVGSHVLSNRDMKSPTSHSMRHHPDVETKPKMESLPSLPRTSSGGHIHVRLSQENSQDRQERDVAQREHSGQAINLSMRQDHKPSSTTLPNPWGEARPSSRADISVAEGRTALHASSHVAMGYIPLNVPYRDIIHEPRYPGDQAGPGSLLDSGPNGEGECKVRDPAAMPDPEQVSHADAQRRLVYDWGNSHYPPPMAPGHMGPLPGPRGYLLPYDPMLHLQGMQSEDERRRLVEAGLLPRPMVMCDPSTAQVSGYPTDRPSSMVSPPSGNSKTSPQEAAVTTPDHSSHSADHSAMGVAMETKMIHTVEGIQPQIGQVYTVNAPVITAGGQMIKMDVPATQPPPNSDVKPLILPGAPLQVVSQGKYPQQFVVAPPYGVAAVQSNGQAVDCKDGPAKTEDPPTTSGVNIPVGIAVARQRQEKTTTKKESGDGESTSEEELLDAGRSEDTWSHHSAPELKDRADFHRDQKTLLSNKRTSSGSRDGRSDLGSNLVVTGGTSCSGGPRWQESEARNATAGHPHHLGSSWVPPGHPHPLGPGLWLGPRCPYPVPPGVTGSVDPTHLPMPPPPGGVKLAQDPLTGQLFLIPDWPAYGSGNPSLPPSHQLQLMAQYSQLQQQQQPVVIQPQQQQQQQQPPPQQPKPELMATVAPLPQTKQHKDSEAERDKVIRKKEQRQVQVASRVSPPRRPVAPAVVAARVPSPPPQEHSPVSSVSPSPAPRLPQTRSPHMALPRTSQAGGSTVEDSGSSHEQVGPSGTDKHGPQGQSHPFLPGVPLPPGQPYPLPYPHHLPYFYDPNLVQLRPLGTESSLPATRSQGTSPITVTTSKTTSTATATVSMATTGTATDSLEVKPLRSISTASVQTSTSPDAELLRASVKEQSIQTYGPCDSPGKVLHPTVKTEKPCVIVDSSAQADMPTLEKKDSHCIKDLELMCKDSDSRKSVSPLPPTLIPEGDPLPRHIPDNIPDIDHFKREDSPPPVERTYSDDSEPAKSNMDFSSLDSDALEETDGLKLLSMLAERAEKQVVPEVFSQPLSPAPLPPPVLAPRRATLLDLQLPDLELEFKDLKSDPDSENSSFRCTDSPDINRNYNAPKMCFSDSSSPADKRDNPFSCMRQFSPKKDSALGQFASSVFKIPTSVDNMDAMELEMRMRLAELQRRYKEKQRELARLQPKKEKDDDRLQVKRGPGRPRKRKFSKKNSRHDRSPTKCIKLESERHTTPGKDSSLIKKKSSLSTPGKGIQKTPKKLNTSAFHSPKTIRPAKLTEKDTVGKKTGVCKPSSTKKKTVTPTTTGEPSDSSETPKSKSKEKMTPKSLIKTEDSPIPTSTKPLTVITPSKKVTPSKPFVPKVKSKPKKVEMPHASPPPLLASSSPPSVSTLREYDFPDDDDDDDDDEDDHMLDSLDDSDDDGMKWFDEVKRSTQPSLEDPWATSSTGTSSTQDSFDDFCESGSLNVLAKYASSEMDFMPTSIAAATSAALKSKKRKKRPDDTGMDEFDEVPVKKRKPGRPKKCGSEDSGVTETIVAKKPKKLMMMVAMSQENKEAPQDIKKPVSVKPKPPPKEEVKPKASPKPPVPPVFLDEEWGRRRSERIFLNEPNTSVNNNDVLFKAPAVQQTSLIAPPVSSSTTAGNKTSKSTPAVTTSKPKVIKDKPKPKMTMMQDLSQKVKKKYAKPPTSKSSTLKPAEVPPPATPRSVEPPSAPAEPVKEAVHKVEPECDSDSSSDGDNVPLSTFIERAITPEPRSCVIDKEELRDGVRVLLFMEGLFFEGQVKAIEPPDVYGVVIDGERGSRPHIFSLEELLNDAVIDVKPPSTRYLGEGTRVCAYWSQQFSCLYPGTVSKGSPNPNAEKHLVCVEFDDGDSGRIPMEHIRMLPQDFPLVNTEPNPIMFLGKRRRRTTSEELIADTKERKPSVSDTLSGYQPSDESNKQKRRGPGRPPKKKGSEEEPVVSGNNGNKTAGMPTIDESLHTPLLPERDVDEKLIKPRHPVEGEIMSSEKLSTESSSPCVIQPLDVPVTAPPVVKKKHKHKDRDKEKVKKDKGKSSGQEKGQEHSKHKHHHKKHKDKDKNREKSKEKKHKKHSSSSVSSVSDGVSSPRSTPATPVLTSNSSTNTEPSVEGLFASLTAELNRSPNTSSVGTNTNSATVSMPSAPKKPDLNSPKRSDLTMRIRTNSGEYNRADFTRDLHEETEESQDSTNVSTDEKSRSNQSSDEDNSEEESQMSEAEDLPAEKPKDSDKKTKPTLQKQTSSSGNKKKRDRLPSVENRSKIAAFLPARQLWRWSGKSTKRPGMKGRAKKEFYKAITRGKETIRVGDCAVFLSTGRPNLPYVGRIESLWEAWGGNMVVKVKWFYHPEETKGGKRLMEVKGAIYQSPHVDENDVQTISHKCELLPYPTYKSYRQTEAMEGREYDVDVYYLAGTYDPTIGMITFEKDVKLQER